MQATESLFILNDRKIDNVCKVKNNSQKLCNFISREMEHCIKRLTYMVTRNVMVSVVQRKQFLYDNN